MGHTQIWIRKLSITPLTKSGCCGNTYSINSPSVFGKDSRNVFYKTVVRKRAKHSINKLSTNSTLEAFLVKWYYFRIHLQFKRASTTRSRSLDETSHTNWNEVWKTINHLTRTMSTPHERSESLCVSSTFCMILLQIKSESLLSTLFLFNCSSVFCTCMVRVKALQLFHWGRVKDRPFLGLNN